MDDCEIYCQKVYGTKKKVVKKKIPILPRVLERPRGIPENPVPYLLPEFYKETQRRVNEESPGGGGTGRFAPQESTAIVDPEPPIPPPDPPSGSFSVWTTFPQTPRAYSYTPTHDPSGQYGEQPIQQKLDAYPDHGLVCGMLGYNGVWYDWDGVTTKSLFFPITYTQAEAEAHRKDWYDFIFPDRVNSNYAIRGLKQLYERFLPFADPTSPTIAEYEFWQEIVFKHFRHLAGLNTVELNQDLVIQVRWADERKNTNYWDFVTGTLDSAAGPCGGGTNIHCGATFVPPSLYQWDYYNQGVQPGGVINTYSQSEAILTDYNGCALMKMSRNLRMYMAAASLGDQISGHGQPFLFRGLYGTGLARTKFAGPIQNIPPGYTF